MNTNERTKHATLGITVVGCVLGLALLGCYRSAPPKIPEFTPPPEPVKEQAATTEAVEDPAAPEIEEPVPEEEPAPEPVNVAPAPPPTAPEFEPEPEAPKAPTIVGTWRCVDMIHSGQSMPMPEGMEMTLTFSADGVVTRAISGSPMPAPQSPPGTYTLDGDQISITMDNETRTGTLTLEGNDQVTLEFDEIRLVLSRV